MRGRDQGQVCGRLLAAAWTLSLPCSDLFQGSCLLGDPGSSSPQGTIFNVVTGCHSLGWGEGQVCYWCLVGRGQGCYEHPPVGRTGCSTVIQPYVARVPPTSLSAPPMLQAGTLWTLTPTSALCLCCFSCWGALPAALHFPKSQFSPPPVPVGALLCCPHPPQRPLPEAISDYLVP